jgi:hypothetical protein
MPMIRLRCALLAASLVLVACTQTAPRSSPVREDYPLRSIKLNHGTPLPAGTRFVVQFDNEPAIVYVADGRGGPPIMYKGHDLHAESVKSMMILKTSEARERFRDQTLHAAVLIEIK